jgi:hypothetical protein
VIAPAAAAAASAPPSALSGAGGAGSRDLRQALAGGQRKAEAAAFLSAFETIGNTSCLRFAQPWLQTVAHNAAMRAAYSKVDSSIGPEANTPKAALQTLLYRRNAIEKALNAVFRRLSADLINGEKVKKGILLMMEFVFDDPAITRGWELDLKTMVTNWRMICCSFANSDSKAYLPDISLASLSAAVERDKLEAIMLYRDREYAQQMAGASIILSQWHTVASNVCFNILPAMLLACRLKERMHAEAEKNPTTRVEVLDRLRVELHSARAALTHEMTDFTLTKLPPYGYMNNSKPPDVLTERIEYFGRGAESLQRMPISSGHWGHTESREPNESGGSL